MIVKRADMIIFCFRLSKNTSMTIMSGLIFTNLFKID